MGARQRRRGDRLIFIVLEAEGRRRFIFQAQRPAVQHRRHRIVAPGIHARVRLQGVTPGQREHGWIADLIFNVVSEQRRRRHGTDVHDGPAVPILGDRGRPRERRPAERRGGRRRLGRRG